MRLLIVGFAASIHTARYLAQLIGSGWEVHLLDSGGGGLPHPDLRELTLHVPDDVAVDELHPSVGVCSYSPTLGDLARSRARRLAELVNELQPEVLHSHELQHAGFLTLEARRMVSGRFPPWLLTNWGSDLSLFARYKNPRVEAVLRACDYYGAECHRDVAQARLCGFRGHSIGVWPVAGGFSLERCRELRASGPSSGRRAIAIKGAAGWFGRGEIVLEAFERCVARLRGYELCLYSGRPELRDRWWRLAERAGAKLIEVGAAGSATSHEGMLRVHGRARTSVSLSIGDGLSTSLLEAAVMGSLPISSDTGCGAEVSAPGVAALYSPPEDPAALARCLARALEESELVDTAAQANLRMAECYLDQSVIRARVLDAYERIAGEATLIAEAA